MSGTQPTSAGVSTTEQRIQGFMKGINRSPYHGFSVEFSEYREYSPGDDPRYLYWRLYARSDRYYVKRFEDEMRRQAPLGFTLATEVADWLALRGIPFSEAHEITGALVRACEEQGIELGEVSVATLAQVDARLEASVLEHVTLEAAVAARSGYGGTAPARVEEQITRLRAAIDRQTAWAADYRGPSW